MGDSRASRNLIYQKMGKTNLVSQPVPTKSYSTKQARRGKNFSKRTEGIIKNLRAKKRRTKKG